MQLLAAIRSVIGNSKIDDALTDGKAEIEARYTRFTRIID